MSWWQVAGTALSIYSSWKQGEDAKDRADDQAAFLRDVSVHNRDISLLDASAAEKDARAAEQAFGRKLQSHLRQVGQVIGRTKARIGKSGVALTGSALDTVVESARAGATDTAMIINEGKTAYTKGMDVAQRYRKLAEYGLRDAAYQASLLEQAGEDKQQYYQYQAGAKAIGFFDEYGQQKGWWE